MVVDGALFGLAAKKGVTSAVLIVVGILVAGILGLSIPLGLSVGDIISKIFSIFAWQAQHGAGAVIYTFPIFWIIGFALGIWKG